MALKKRFLTTSSDIVDPKGKGAIRNQNILEAKNILGGSSSNSWRAELTVIINAIAVSLRGRTVRSHRWEGVLRCTNHIINPVDNEPMMRDFTMLTTLWVWIMLVGVSIHTKTWRGLLTDFRTRGKPADTIKSTWCQLPRRSRESSSQRTWEGKTSRISSKSVHLQCIRNVRCWLFAAGSSNVFV